MRPAMNHPRPVFVDRTGRRRRLVRRLGVGVVALAVAYGGTFAVLASFFSVDAPWTALLPDATEEPEEAGPTAQADAGQEVAAAAAAGADEDSEAEVAEPAAPEPTRGEAATTSSASPTPTPAATPSATPTEPAQPAPSATPSRGQGTPPDPPGRSGEGGGGGGKPTDLPTTPSRPATS